MPTATPQRCQQLPINPETQNPYQGPKFLRCKHHHVCPTPCDTHLVTPAKLLSRNLKDKPNQAFKLRHAGGNTRSTALAANGWLKLAANGYRLRQPHYWHRAWRNRDLGSTSANCMILQCHMIADFIFHITQQDTFRLTLKECQLC